MIDRAVARRFVGHNGVDYSSGVQNVAVYLVAVHRWVVADRIGSRKVVVEVEVVFVQILVVGVTYCQIVARHDMMVSNHFVVHRLNFIDFHYVRQVK